MAEPVILWLRQDLRLRDNPALVAAAKAGPVLPVYILDDDAAGNWAMGGAQRWWLHYTLEAFGASLAEKGSRLILRRGAAVEILRSLCDETGATAIHATRQYEPWWRDADAELGDRLTLHDGNHLAPVEDVTSGSGGLYKIYSAFWRGLQEHLPPEAPLPVPGSIPAPTAWPDSDALDDWALLPKELDWAEGFEVWTPGEHEAQLAVRRFAKRLDVYDHDRDFPGIEGTSRLSPHLHFGEISARDVWHRVGGGAQAETFRKELAWRDFTKSVIVDRPDYGDEHGREKYAKLPFRTAKADLKAWQKGRTGYPIVDAGMRQLWRTGWMHNRVRMIVASFLVKHLLIDWREGERWFWDCLVDADYGNNATNWQWVAGTGIDSNMWSRIMAPLTQSEKFDAAGYIREWVPELADVPDDAIHDPDATGCRPDDYPAKIIGHREARERALEAGRKVR